MALWALTYESNELAPAVISTCILTYQEVIQNSILEYSSYSYYHFDLEKLEISKLNDFGHFLPAGITLLLLNV